MAIAFFHFFTFSKVVADFAENMHTGVFDHRVPESGVRISKKPIPVPPQPFKVKINDFRPLQRLVTQKLFHIRNERP